MKKVIITFETDRENKQRKNSWHDCKLNYKHFSASGACGDNYHSLWIHSRPPPPPFACMTGNDCVDLHSTSIKRDRWILEQVDYSKLTDLQVLQDRSTRWDAHFL